MCKQAGDKWLMGTDEPTMLDIHVFSVLEGLYLIMDIFPEVNDVIQMRTNAPALFAMLERFRAYPAFRSHRQREPAMKAHMIRTRAWKQGEKCQLSKEIIEGVYESDP